jgi:hypothetical protein
MYLSSLPHPVHQYDFPRPACKTSQGCHREVSAPLPNSEIPNLPNNIQAGVQPVHRDGTRVELRVYFTLLLFHFRLLEVLARAGRTKET